jgi:hypothetical protein
MNRAQRKALLLGLLGAALAVSWVVTIFIHTPTADPSDNAVKVTAPGSPASTSGDSGKLIAEGSTAAVRAQIRGGFVLTEANKDLRSEALVLDSWDALRQLVEADLTRDGVKISRQAIELSLARHMDSLKPGTKVLVLKVVPDPALDYACQIQLIVSDNVGYGHDVGQIWWTACRFLEGIPK